MARKATIITIAPSVLILMTAFLSFCFTWKAFFSISLVLVFPILYLYQGILACKYKTSLFPALGSTTLTFFIIAQIYLNASAYGYIPIYVAAGLDRKSVV